jgi:hypothetical protein
MDLRGLVDLASGFLREQMSGFQHLLRKKAHLSVNTAWMELSFHVLPNDAIYVLGLGGEHGGIMKLDAVS